MRSRAEAAGGWGGRDGSFQESPEIKGHIRSGRWIPEHDLGDVALQLRSKVQT